MTSAHRLGLAHELEKVALMRGAAKVAPNLLRNAWSNVGTMGKLGIGGAAAGAGYGAYRMFRPNGNGIFGHVQQQTQQQNSDLNQLYQGFNGSPRR